MISSINPDIQRNLYELGEVTVNFLTRVTQLTNAGLQGAENRVYQAGTGYGASALKQWSSLAKNKNVQELGDLQKQWLVERQDAYMDILCNSQQVALLTHDEMQYWIRRMVGGWLSLVGSFCSTAKSA